MKSKGMVIGVEAEEVHSLTCRIPRDKGFFALVTRNSADRLGFTVAGDFSLIRDERGQQMRWI